MVANIAREVGTQSAFSLFSLRVTNCWLSDLLLGFFFFFCIESVLSGVVSCGEKQCGGEKRKTGRGTGGGEKDEKYTRKNNYEDFCSAFKQ